MIAKYIDKAETFLLTHLKSSSTVLTFMTILGTVTSSLAQQASINKNKELPKDKKEFLINQEQKDCFLSASLTWLVSKCAKEGINYLTNNGYLLNNSVRDITDGIAKSHNLTHRELAKTGFFNMDAPGQSASTIIGNIKIYPELKKNFKRCKEGLSVIGTVAAAILTTNFIVPVFRNLLIKKNIEAKKVEEQPVSIERIMTDRYMPRVFKNDAQLSSLYNTYPSSNLRI